MNHAANKQWRRSRWARSSNYGNSARHIQNNRSYRLLNKCLSRQPNISTKIGEPCQYESQPDIQKLAALDRNNTKIANLPLKFKWLTMLTIIQVQSGRTCQGQTRFWRTCRWKHGKLANLPRSNILLAGLPHGSYKEKQGFHGFQISKRQPGRICSNKVNNCTNWQLLNFLANLPAQRKDTS